jgi:hypothetical protein
LEIVDSGLATGDYCREIETYLCKKNDGHLIRVVGPSFDLVAAWAGRGVPLKIAFAGIDRYFERYYGRGPRRRPVKIDFCEADVLDVFDEWRRATGLPSPRASNASTPSDSGDGGADAHRRGSSLPKHLERVVAKLTQARAGGTIGEEFDALIDGVARELDAARQAHGMRGESRSAMIARLAAIDARMIEAARTALPPGDSRAISAEADEMMASYRATMAPDAFMRAHAAATDRLVRERLRLPIVAFE